MINLRSKLGIAFALLIAAFAALSAPAGDGVMTAGTNAVAVLRTAAAVRGLSRDAAQQGAPVELRGVVTVSWPDGAGDGFIMNDGTADVFVEDTLTTEYGPGMRVEVIGLTDSGGYAPTVKPQSVRRVGRGELPPARPATVAELLTGQLDCQRVEVRGVIQSVSYAPKDGALNCGLATESGCIVVNIMPAQPSDGADLVDAEVLVRGVCVPIFNSRSELMGVRLRTNSYGDLKVIVPPPADPFGVPRIRLDRLLPFCSEGLALHRRCAVGVVTAAQTNGLFYIQEGKQGVRVRTRPELTPDIGATVEVSGFIESEGFFSGFANACVRTRAPQSPKPMPDQVRPETILNYVTSKNEVLPDYDGRLVRMRGRLQKMGFDTPEGACLYLDCEGYLVRVDCGSDSRLKLAALRLDSEIEVTGVCEVSYSRLRPVLNESKAVGFRLLLRSPADLVVIRRASWWTVNRLLVLLGGLIVVLAGVMLWNMQLHKLVEKRSVQLADEMRDRLAAESRVSERTRLAAELHDSMAQSLTGVALQLRSARKAYERDPQSLTSHWDLAEKLLAASRDEIHRCVWDLNSPLLDTGELDDALGETARQMSGDSVIQVRTVGTPRKLPDLIAHGLLRVGQEAMTNAVNHGAATKVDILLEYGEDTVNLSVTDDGRGFDPARAAGAGAGHFGLQGIRERVKRMRGTFELKSNVGQGTRLTVRIPVSHSPAEKS